MQKVTTPHPVDEKNYIITENVDYFTTGDTSIWGNGDKDTVTFLQKTSLSGTWVNLAAGDGRYNTLLLEKVDTVIATDIDEGALSKLWHQTPRSLQPKLITKTFDLTKPFPIDTAYVDGVFCTGTLHLFPPSLLEQILKEIDRITKRDGHILIDFATDIKRVYPDGSLKKRGNEVAYTLEEGKSLFRTTLPNYSYEFIDSSVPEEKVTIGNTYYMFSCNYFLVYGKKLQ